jgi:hypothetical protein
MAALAIAIAVVAPATAHAAVTVSRAEVSSGGLRIEGRALANRSITVDGLPMATSDGSGLFRVSRSAYRPAVDANGATAPLTYSVTINAASTLDFTSETGSFQLGNEVGQYVIPLEVGTFANRFFNGSGGVLPYSWAVAAGTLPPGMSLIQDNPDGQSARIGGTPTTAGTYGFTLRLADAQGATVTHDVTATIGNGTLPPPSSLTSLTLSPSTLTGGAASTATVTLGSAAPSQGGFVTLSSSNKPAATVPASVTVPAGSTTATFPVSTAAVTSSTTSTISATYGGVTRTATLTVNAAATTAPDTLTITRALYDSRKRTLRVEATSNRTGATLRAYVTSSASSTIFPPFGLPEHCGTA